MPLSLRRRATAALAALGASLLLLGVAPRALPAQQTDVIRGRLLGPDGAPITSAEVTVTSIAGGVNRKGRVDRDGRFTVTVPGGDGDYLVSILAVGYAPKRFQLKRVADEDVLIADARLQRAVVTLDDVKVNARPTVSRTDAPPPDASGTDLAVDAAAVPVASLGDLAAMAAALPGVLLVPGADGAPDGFSVLGLGADQNNVTMNGLQFGGSDLPRDASVSTSLVTAPYDVSRGGFSGGQLALRSRPGSNFIVRGMTATLDSPHAQWTDRSARALGQRFSNVSVGGLASGPIAYDKAFYSVAYQLGRRANDFESLLTAGPLGLRTAGVAADSVARLLGILDRAHVPASAAGIPSDRHRDQGSVFGSVDLAPTSSNSGQAFGVAFAGSWSRQTPALAAATDVPAAGGERASWNGGVQGRHSGYVRGLLSETTIGASGSRTQGTPYLDLPAGQVRVVSDLGDVRSVQTLGFGGSSALGTGQKAGTIGVLNQLSWFSRNSAHRLKLTTELRRDGYVQEQTTNLLGSFSFTSLASLEANRPSAFARQLGARRSAGSQLVGAVSLGDSYRPSAGLQLQYGVRVDANHFLDAPAENADVERTFGVANDHAPNRVSVSPRLGVSWTYGSAPQVRAFEGAQRGPRGVVRGGVGVFRGTPATTILGGAIDNTGLPAAVQQLLCLGGATPSPDWRAYTESQSAIPSRCADGSAGTVFASDAPNVTLVAPGYAAPRSVRGNVQWSGPLLDNRVSAVVDVTYSRNADQPSVVDRNVAPVTRFTLDDEARRPVLVDPASILPSTGTAAARAASVSRQFSRVAELRSDLRSTSRQLRVSVAPVALGGAFIWSVSYVHSSTREQTRGFGGGSTAGDPFDVQWSRAALDSRHQLVYTIGYNVRDLVRLTWFGQFRSGVPFTPLVGGDVNGDGYSSNDRAFVFDPARTSDPTTAARMRALLDGGSALVRRCLERQIGKVAEHNSCGGPWTSTSTLSLVLNPLKVRMPQRATVSLQLSNPVAAADLLLHGASRARGWGQVPVPDPALLSVRGFDPATRRYAYDVNQRFGATDPASSAVRSPVALTALVRVDVGPSRERQALAQQLDRGRTRPGTKATESLLRSAYATGGVPNPLAALIRQRDTLRLTGPQADTIAALNRAYTAYVDSLWTPVARTFAAFPDRYDRGDAYDRYQAARRASVDRLIALSARVRSLLTAEQTRRLPTAVAAYLDPRVLAAIRSGTLAFTGGAVSPNGASAGGGEARTIPRGGGGVATPQ